MEQNKQAVDIDEFVHDGVHYYHFLSRCPVDSSRGHGAPSFWMHGECGGDIYIGDDATFYCKSCGTKFHIFHARFTCPSHSCTEDYMVSYSPQLSYCDVVESMGETIRVAGISWIVRFLQNL